MKLSEIKNNPDNPRVISDAQFEKLQNSIREFPQMMSLRPIIIGDDSIILGGNMRRDALEALGFDEIPEEWVKRASDLTDEQKREFILKDNVAFGEWDYALLNSTEWLELPVQDWGLELPVFTPLQPDALDQFFIEDNLKNEVSGKIVLHYPEAECETVKTKLAEIAKTPEQAVWKLLNL